ncbi:MAG: hypothetical protein AAGB13_02220 [Cyanobacteria bacterium P01_F01_bin.33]
MESRTTFFGPVLAIIALASLAISGIPIPTEIQDEETVSPVALPKYLRDRAIAFTSVR